MAVHVFSATLCGFDCKLVDIEVDILNGLSSITIVGLGDTSVQESKERIRSAIKNSGAEYPRRKKVVNLAPADLRKHGPMFDLPIALGLLLNSGQIPDTCLENTCVVGELSLDGSVRRVAGALAIADFAQRIGYRTLLVPAENAAEAAHIEGIEVIGITSLRELVAHLNGQPQIPPQPREESVWCGQKPDKAAWNFEDIRGHESIKRALIIAASGHHNLLLYGPPGSGKTILASSMAGILPPFTTLEALEVTKIYSVAGKLAPGQSIISTPPFRAVHHTSSISALIGGGSVPHPGEISLAHHGVFFMDEFLEFPRAAIDALRQPLEHGYIHVGRARMSCTFPSDIMLVAATNPCPCGYFQDPVKACTCTPSRRQQYMEKLSGPMLDRIDMVCYVPRLSVEEIQSTTHGTTSADARAQVEAARRIQYTRGQLNSRATASYMEHNFHISKEALNLLEEASHKLHYSGRVYHRLLRVARTIADIEHSDHIEHRHIAEAFQYRPRWGEHSS